MPKGWLTCFAVASTDDAVALVEAKGGTVVMPPEDTPFGRFAVVEDPGGASFELLQQEDPALPSLTGPGRVSGRGRQPRSWPYACSGRNRTTSRRSATMAARYSSQFPCSPDTPR